MSDRDDRDIIRIDADCVRLNHVDSIRIGLAPLDDGLMCVMTISDRRLGQFSLPLWGGDIAYLLQALGNINALTPEQVTQRHAELRARITEAEGSHDA